MDAARADIGVIGGSGLASLASQEGQAEVVLSTPWGDPSGPYRIGAVAGRRVAFLARHGAGHKLSPSDINYRANIWGFKQLGVTRLIAASAVGSLSESLAPRHFVIVDQFIDRTHRRIGTFFGSGVVAHVSLADPTCLELRPLAASAAREAGARVTEGGTYHCMEGPQFSTRAESKMYRAAGADVIGMTNATEARLAREAELCYCPIAMVTDYDCWHEDEAPVSVEALLQVLRDNASQASDVIAKLIGALPEGRSCSCGTALASAVITSPEAIPPATAEQLALLLRRR